MAVVALTLFYTEKSSPNENNRIPILICFLGLFILMAVYRIIWEAIDPRIMNHKAVPRWGESQGKPLQECEKQALFQLKEFYDEDPEAFMPADDFIKVLNWDSETGNTVLVGLYKKALISAHPYPNEPGKKLIKLTPEGVKALTIISRGDDGMIITPNPWISGLFYLVVVVIVGMLCLFMAKMVNAFTLPIVIIGTLLLVSVVGAFQLRQDSKLSQKNFLSLMLIVFKQVPFLRRKKDRKRKRF